MVTLALELIVYGVIIAATVFFYGWLVTPFLMLKGLFYLKILTKDFLRVTGNFLTILFSGYLVWAVVTIVTTMFTGEKKMKIVSIMDKIQGVLDKISFGRLNNIITTIENWDGHYKYGVIISIPLVLSLTGVLIIFSIVVACIANYPYILIALVIDGLIFLVKHFVMNVSVTIDEESARAILKKQIPNPFSRFFHKGKSDATDKSAETSC